ncbi:Imm63 family immunity protein [Pantoea sp. Ae16]|uniref:Imm63 family immunity protein n=1 Tax=Pantoea sp. Ae16 TaxID=1890373 RepID=UPI0008FD4B4D|nr:Imm63 family immunity protein [Pantoea sp. Ae16]OIX90645.1 hypothetical protein BFS13_10730 [Pantoea sp. Ae16]
MENISAIQSKVFQLGSKVSAPHNALIILTEPSDYGKPRLNISQDSYEYIYSERGYEFSRKSTKNLDELLYCIICPVVHEMAMEFELTHRVNEDEDCRKIIFPKLIEYLRIINPLWAERAKKELPSL